MIAAEARQRDEQANGSRGNNGTIAWREREKKK